MKLFLDNYHPSFSAFFSSPSAFLMFFPVFVFLPLISTLISLIVIPFVTFLPSSHLATSLFSLLSSVSPPSQIHADFSFTFFVLNFASCPQMPNPINDILPSPCPLLFPSLLFFSPSIISLFHPSSSQEMRFELIGSFPPAPGLTLACLTLANTYSQTHLCHLYLRMILTHLLPSCLYARNHELPTSNPSTLLTTGTQTQIAHAHVPLHSASLFHLTNHPQLALA